MTEYLSKPELRRKFLFICCLVCICCGLLVGLGIGYVAFSTNLKYSEAFSEAHSEQQMDVIIWQEKLCSATCRRNWKQLPLLLISLDGFRADYLKRNVSSALNKLIKCGSHAPFIYPSYPSETFPNHYTIATGLYPEAHGIVGNNMLDPSIFPKNESRFSLGSAASLNTGWWGGEPIWQTVTKNGHRSATYFWPGSDVRINDMYPDDYRVFNHKTGYVEIVEQVLRWLNEHDSTRPAFITAYFDEPDHTAHESGPESKKVYDKILLVDAIIERLMRALDHSGLIGCVNMIILADHGMQKTPKNQKIVISNYLKKLNGLQVFGGINSRILVQNTSWTPEEIVANMSCRNGSFKVYTRDTVPTRLHYSSHGRIGDVVIVAEPGYVVQRDARVGGTTLLGGHGYDFRTESMHALFLAYGPAFKTAYVCQPFQNVELYNLMTEIMGLQLVAPNNGTPGALSHLLVNPRPFSVPSTKQPIPKCTLFGVNFKRSVSSCGRNCSLNLPTRESTTCSNMFQLDSAVSLSDDSQICALSSCSTSSLHVADSSTSSLSLRLVGLKTGPSSIRFQNLSSSTHNNCFFVTHEDQCEQLLAVQQNLISKGYGLYSLVPHREIWLTLLQKVDAYTTSHWAELLLFAGPVFDSNNDGVADTLSETEQRAQLRADPLPIPSHVFLILVRCRRGFWNNEDRCNNGTEQVTSFSIPNRDLPENCPQDITDYLFSHTAKVKDIERQTAMNFFSGWSTEVALRLRIHVNQNSWILSN